MGDGELTPEEYLRQFGPVMPSDTPLTIPDQINQQIPGFYSSVDADSDEVTKWQLSTEKQLQKLEQYLSGRIYDPKSNQYITVDGVGPMMNNLGIRYTLFTLRGLLDKNTGLSDIDDAHCLSITRSITLAYLNNMILNLDKYCIKVSDIPAIKRIFQANSYLLLRRAVDGGERELIKTIRKEQYVMREQDMNNNQKKGFWSNILPSNWNNGGRNE